MSLFQCENCGCCENTALAGPVIRFMSEIFDWTGIEHLRGKELCSVCAPQKYRDGTSTEYGKWHNVFERTFLPKGKFFTNNKGNLEHIETGSEDFKKYRINKD